jgi:uncharacterized membrane protein
MLSSLRDTSKNLQISKREILLVLSLLLFGIPMIILIPPGAGYDEEDHLVRVWELSAFSWIPGSLRPQEMQYPTIYRDFAYRQQGSTGVIDAEFWEQFWGASFYERGYVRRDLDTKSVYSPVLLLPQAMAMRLFGRIADLPALTVFYLSRLAGLLSYLALTWLALRWMPFGKWILVVLALSPIALFQATTLTPDTISNGIGFLFIAGCLRLEENRQIRWQEAGYLTGLVALLFLAKLNLVPLILLPFLLFAPPRFIHRRIYIAFLVAVAVLLVVEVAGWNLVASLNIEPLMANDANLPGQLRYILAHPFNFIRIILNDLITNGWAYIQGWINGYGYYYWTPPAIVSLLFALGLGSAIAADSTSEHVDRRLRWIFLLVFAAGYLATVLSIYTTFTPVASQEILGIQGRYFVTLALLLLLVLASFVRTPIATGNVPRWLTAFLSSALFLNLLGLFLAFHIPCGSTFYQTGLCYRPLFKDFPSNVRPSPPITNDLRLTQEIGVTCNGLTELRLLLIPADGQNQGTARFVLREDKSGEALLDTLLASDQVSIDDWYSLRFAPDWLSAGKHYTLEIYSANGSSDTGVSVLYTRQPEFNLGDLREGSQVLEEDIVVQYGCATGLRKLWMTVMP